MVKTLAPEDNTSSNSRDFKRCFEFPWVQAENVSLSLYFLSKDQLDRDYYAFKNHCTTNIAQLYSHTIKLRESLSQDEFLIRFEGLPRN